MNSATTNGGWQIFNAILGWNNTATLGSILSYVLYWVAVCIALASEFRKLESTIRSSLAILGLWYPILSKAKTSTDLAFFFSLPYVQSSNGKKVDSYSSVKLLQHGTESKHTKPTPSLKTNMIKESLNLLLLVVVDRVWIVLIIKSFRMMNMGLWICWIRMGQGWIRWWMIRRNKWDVGTKDDYKKVSKAWERVEIRYPSGKNGENCIVPETNKCIVIIKP